MLLSMMLVAVALAVPPALKVIAVSGLVYAVIQGAKKSPWLGSMIQGWWAVALNVVLTVSGIVAVIPADQLYTMQTLETTILAVLASAGIHGTVQNAVMKK